MLHAALLTLHWGAFDGWVIIDKKALECMFVLTSHVQLLLDALSQKNEKIASSACGDAANPLKKLHWMADFDRACTSPNTML